MKLEKKKGRRRKEKEREKKPYTLSKFYDHISICLKVTNVQYKGGKEKEGKGVTRLWLKILVPLV